VFPVEPVLQNDRLAVEQCISMAVVLVFEFVQMEVVPRQAVVEYLARELAPQFGVQQVIFVVSSLTEDVHPCVNFAGFDVFVFEQINLVVICFEILLVS
jgi:hypothetical protein